MLTPQPHNDGCQRPYLIQYDKVTGRVYPLPTFRGRWDCPACAAHKLAKLTSHIVSRADSLCYGVHSDSKRRLALRRGLGWFSLTFTDAPKLLIVESHLYTPQLSADQVLYEVSAIVADNQVSRLSWSDKWRPTKDGTDRYDIIQTDTLNYADVMAALGRIAPDGKVKLNRWDEVKDRLDTMLNGVGWA